LPRPPRTRREQLRLALLRIAGPLTRTFVPQTNPNAPTERILVVSPDHLGDLLFATPALRALREAFRPAHITWMVGPWGQALAGRCQFVDDVLALPFPGFERPERKGPRGQPAWAPYQVLNEQVQRLRKSGAYDVALLLRPDHWWGAWLCALAGIGRRVGYALPEMIPFLTQPVSYQPQRHVVEKNMTLVQALAGQGLGEPQGLDFPVSEQDLEKVSARLRLGQAASEPVVAIHPGAGSGVKRWRPEAWAHVADALVEKYSARILLTGSADEADLTWAVAARMRHPADVLAGQTNLTELAATLALATVVIGSDSGPLHLAVAVGTPTVHLYGPADARLYGPWGNPATHPVLTSNWPCLPCNRLDYPRSEWAMHPCVHDIREDQVLSTVEALLGEPEPGRRTMSDGRRKADNGMSTSKRRNAPHLSIVKPKLDPPPSPQADDDDPILNPPF